jgi:phage anti-repressor protein
VYEIKIEDNILKNELTQTVNARELHEWLNSNRQFSNWITDKITAFGFKDNEDYLTILFNRKGGKAGKPRTEYYITIDMAKELSMLERTEKGREIRKYFIDIEKRFYKIKEDIQNKEVRSLSKKYRNNFTFTLKNHGLEKRHEYIQITYIMKEGLNISRAKKKEEYNDIELLKTASAECLSTVNIINKNARGYYEIKPICDNISKIIEKATLNTIENSL